ncbi:unnamed protein product [Echinostoma caproni]|uniref:Zf_UBZ domain-containing protein n=1 Tax=Echinostoma caproni TaxID=27848 RepID=A0A183AFF0_9TREM|nr:unnamed protein product [Echinostoma caproni]
MFMHPDTPTPTAIKAGDATVTESVHDTDKEQNRKSSPIRSEEDHTAFTSVPNSASVGTSSFFKRLRVAELSAPQCPPPPALTVALQPSVHELDDTSECAPTESDPIIEPDSNSRSSSTSDTPGVFFTSYVAGDWIICDECGSRISVWQVPEHSDFHVAQRVQQDWTREATSNLLMTRKAPASSSLPSTTSSSMCKSKPAARPNPSGRCTKRSRGSQKVPVVAGTLDRFVRPSRSSP